MPASPRNDRCLPIRGVKAITADQRLSNRMALALNAACLLAVVAAFFYLIFPILSYAFQQDSATHAFAVLHL